jgi:putative membrane protein
VATSEKFVHKPPEDPRVRFAADRTLLAWIRTGLAMMGFGFVVARFAVFLRAMEGSSPSTSSHSPGYSLWIGAGLIALGVAVNVFSALGHLQFLRRHNAGLDYEAPKWSAAVVAALLLAVVGVAMVIYLMNLPGQISAPVVQD